MKGVKVLLTGGAGLIGSQVASDLNKQGITSIVVVDHLGKSEKWKNLNRFQFSDYWEKTELSSLLEKKTDWIEDFTHIIHLGACSSTTETDASYLMYNNFKFTKDLAELAVSKKIRFLYASSAATYGDGSQGYDDESDISQLKPLNAYGLSKHMFDLYAQKTKLSKKILGLKYFNVFGFGEFHKGDMRSLVLKGALEVSQTKKIQLFKSYRPEYPDGEQKRDFLYVKDASAITTYLLFSESTGLLNVGRGIAESWNELAKALFKALDLPTKIEYKEMPETLIPKYQYFTCATTKRLRETGYIQTFTPLGEAVQDYMNLLKQEGTLA